MKKTSGLMGLFEPITKYLVMLYQGLAVLAMIAIPFLAVQYFQLPFLGVFLEHTLVTNDVGPDDNTQPEWFLYNKGLHFGNQLVSISILDQGNDRLETLEPKSFTEIETLLKKYAPGQRIAATFESPEGRTIVYTGALTTFPLADQTRYFYIPYLIGIIYLLTSLWIFGLRRSETAGRAFSVLASSVAIVVAGLLDVYTTNRLVYLWLAAVPLVGASLIHLGLVFPQEARAFLRYPFLRWMGYVVAGGLILLQYSSLFDFSRPRFYASTWMLSYIFVGLSILFFIGSTLYRRYQSPSPVVRQQARIILLGALFGFAPITLWLLFFSLSKVLFPSSAQLNFNPYIGFMPLIIFPVTTGYTVMRYRLLRTDYLVSRGISYALLVVLALSGYFFLALGSGLLLGTTLGPDNPVLIAVTIILVAFLFNTVRSRLQVRIDRIFFRGERVHQDRLNLFTRELTNAVTLAEILRILREHTTASLMPNLFHIFLYDPLSDQYLATPDETGQPTSDIRFTADSSLPAVLRSERLPIFVDQDRVPESIRAERGRLMLLGTQLFIPMPGRERLVGWLALGDRISGESYASHDISFLEALGSQAAVALGRAQVVTNMERRVHEMNALSRVAQGINITLNFDDILELIYAQTAQIIPSSDFHLTLFNKTGQYAYYAFCLENDERIPSQENIPLLPKTTLDQEVIISRRPIIAQDFSSQIQILGVTPLSKGVYAWMGVPLNAGVETIGVVSVASNDPSVTYTDGQLDLLQSVANQTAGAIVKSRLLLETERRAQQLSTLSVITRQLTSTLELQPLLKSILESAVQILNTEAGSLFLVDPQTDELIFQVTVGPVAQNLAGQRLPPGTGFVGKAAINRRPVIVNDVAATSTWNPAPDKQTGFVTRTILAIPMEVKDRVSGVIEIINKKDGNPFTDDDQNLLSAFAGQAAVAIENARLYTMTDQELTARVEELSVMQRIDRELNASLEENRAMRITLEWAMRQSKSEAGLIGFVEAKGIRVMADQGYGQEVETFKEDYLPLDHLSVQAAIETGLPQRVVFSAPNPAQAFLNDTHSQLVIPIRREASVIGLLLLESTKSEAFQQDALAFLSRLSDHAAIAISNAQLYAQVQQANIAKSEFVSFVAHELKNPMTPIKGFSDLLASGVVGPINENQAKFLATIRSNVERMKTIVEDLNDNSKIEAGRMELKFKDIDVYDLVETVVRSSTRQAEDKQQVIEVVLPPDLPKAWADRVRTEQVLINLVSNAYKYTQEGGHIIIQAEKAANQWDPQGSPFVLHMWVKDNGYGISPEDQKKIFQKFFRSPDDQARKSPGTGLGLNITKSLVEMQGGRIWFESEFRKGTTFHITVPVSEN
jgi:signal transduction histidine kinase